jgi:hypothetical protein
MAWRLVLSDAWRGDTAADEPELTLFNGLLEGRCLASDRPVMRKLFSRRSADLVG